MLDIAKAVVQFIRKHTSDVSTAQGILSSAGNAFGGGFTQGARDRLEARLSLSESSQALLEPDVKA
jgi:hypothetical protein